jgi:hypothetical protein
LLTDLAIPSHDVSVHHGGRVADWQEMVGHHRTTVGQTLRQPHTIAGRSTTVLLTVEDQDRRAIETGRQIIPEV